MGALIESLTNERAEAAKARVVRCVELPPGSVVVTREEAKVLRAAVKLCSLHPFTTASTEQGEKLTDAVAALRATKGRRK